MIIFLGWNNSISMACFLLQILQAKRKLRLTSAGPKEGSSAAPPGEAITHFEPPSRTIAVLKKEIREATNRIGEELDEGTREAVVAEGLKVSVTAIESINQYNRLLNVTEIVFTLLKVFELNNVVIRSVRGVNDIFYRKLMWLVTVVAVLAVVLKFALF